MNGGSVTNLVNGAIASAHASISGEPHLLPTTTSDVAPTQFFQSASLPMGSRVLDKLKLKIWNEAFVEFGSLLSNPSLEKKYQISFQNSDAGQPVSFCLEPAPKPKKVLTIDMWLHAFHIFVGVYTQKHPSEARPHEIRAYNSGFGSSRPELEVLRWELSFFEANSSQYCCMEFDPLGTMASVAVFSE